MSADTHNDLAQAPWTAPSLLARPVIANGFLPVVRWISEGVRARTPAHSRNESEIALRWKAILLADPCPYCGIVRSENIDHVQPRSAGGGGQWFNLTGACQECNGDKSSTPLLLFMLTHKPTSYADRKWRRRNSSRNKTLRSLNRHVARQQAIRGQGFGLMREQMARALRGDA